MPSIPCAPRKVAAAGKGAVPPLLRDAGGERGELLKAGVDEGEDASARSSTPQTSAIIRSERSKSSPKSVPCSSATQAMPVSRWRRSATSEAAVQKMTSAPVRIIASLL